MADKKVYYMHTIDGQPATFTPPHSLTFVTSPRCRITLAGSLRQIREEQGKHLAWRKQLGFQSIFRYGYRRVVL